MIVLEHFSQLKAWRNITFVGTIGNFDGLHAAHQKILSDVRRIAKRREARSLVITFHHELGRTGRKKKPLLTSLQHKLFLMQRAGIDFCYVFSFQPSFKKISAERFLKNVLFKKFSFSHIIVGYNFRFGKARQGKPALIKQYARRRNIGCTIERPITYARRRISSSRIRALIMRGHLQHAKQLLGRNYSVFASIVRGAGRGKSLGFPTANLDVHSEIMPPCGVYSVKVNIWDITYKRDAKGMRIHNRLWKKNLTGVLNFGCSPTFSHARSSRAGAHAEVHILGIARDVKGKLLEIVFYNRLRGEKRFSDSRALCKQIGKDINQAVSYFKKKQC